MSIHERQSKIPNSAVLDFRRPQNINNDPKYSSSHYERTITLGNFLKDIKSQERLVEAIGNVEVLGVAGGDGTFGTAIYVGVMNPNIEALVALGGGTTNSLLTALRRYPKSSIPDNLTKRFHPNFYTAITYSPPFVFIDDNQGRFSAYAYLYAVDHLAMETTKQFDSIRARDPNGNLQHSYIRAGLKSALVLFDSEFVPLKPTQLRYGINGEVRVEPEVLSYLVIDVIAVPILATFKFISDIDKNKLRLLTLSGRDKRELRSRYVLALAVGALFGVDRVTRWGIAESRDVDWVSFIPDQTDPQRPNVNKDGEVGRIDIGRVDGSVLLTRSPEVLERELVGREVRQEVTIIIPKYLL